MKIWTKCVWDKDGRIIEEEFHEHDGPIAECKGGSSQTIVQPAQPTPEETALTQKQVELAEFQLEELRRQSAEQTSFSETLQPLIETQAEEARLQRELQQAANEDSREIIRLQEQGLISADEAAKRQFDLQQRQIETSEQQAQKQIELQQAQLDIALKAAEQAEKQFPIQDELNQLALEDLRRGGAASPEQLALIQEAGDAAVEQGSTDIERFRTQSLEALREELAPSLGLRPGDSPLLDRGSKVAAEATRQGGQLAQSVRGAQATARLNFPLAQSQLLQASALGQQQLSQATTQFQENLRSQAFSNRLNLQQQVGGLGLGLATGLTVPFPGFSRGSTTTQSGGGGSALNTAFTGIGAVGGLLGGVGALAAFSSSELKENKEQVDENAALEGVSRLPVEMWRYRKGIGLDSDKIHVGTYAENFRNTFGLGDGQTLDMIDTTGVLMASVKALDKKVKILEMERKGDGSFGLAA